MSKPEPLEECYRRRVIARNRGEDDRQGMRRRGPCDGSVRGVGFWQPGVCHAARLVG